MFYDTLHPFISFYFLIYPQDCIYMVLPCIFAD